MSVELFLGDVAGAEQLGQLGDLVGDAKMTAALLDRLTPDQAYFNALAPMMVAAQSTQKST